MLFLFLDALSVELKLNIQLTNNAEKAHPSLEFLEPYENHAGNVQSYLHLRPDYATIAQRHFWLGRKTGSIDENYMTCHHQLTACVETGNQGMRYENGYKISGQSTEHQYGSYGLLSFPASSVLGFCSSV